MINIPEVSVIMAVFNDESYFEVAVNSVLNQSFKNFEFIIVNDHSTDGTIKILENINDERVKIINNKKNLGIAKTRNIGIQTALGKYIFFTDSDCEADEDWLKNGLPVLENIDTKGVEGLTFYVSKDYIPKVDDKLPGTLMTEGHYMTANMGYKKDILVKINGFDERYVYNSDRDVALKVLAHGNIEFCKDMVVNHQKKIWTPISFIKSAERVRDRIRLMKYRDERLYMLGFIMYPRNMVKILFPPLIFLPILKGKCRTFNHFIIVLASYPRAIYERLIIWKTALELRVFII
jgi:glycosyltransferase involved in cell wall biosynthesis